MKPSGKEHNKIRLQVYLSRSGYCSRRAAMDIIKEGRVKVNGTLVSEPSTPVDYNDDKIRVDGKRIGADEYSYILLNKPAGCVTTRRDKHAKKTIYDLLPGDFKRLVPAGRLDKETEGLLLLTNNGDVTYRLTHPKYNLNKTYLVRIFGELENSLKQKLERGVTVERKKTAPAQIDNISVSKGQTQFHMTIHEGRKRQIRLMLKSVGKRVVYLKRISQGPLKLGSLKVGTFRRLTKNEIKELNSL